MEEVSGTIEIKQAYTYPFLSGLVEYNPKERELMDEIRNIDKANSRLEKNSRGHFICITGQKRTDSIRLGSEMYNVILKELHGLGIQFNVIDQASVVSAKQYQKIVRKMTKKDADVLKLIALQKSDKDKKAMQVDLLIMPVQNHFSNEKYGGYLMGEEKKDSLFGVGPISPLVILQNALKIFKIEANCYFANLDSLTKTYVVFSAGDNQHAIIMNREDFVAILKKQNVKEYQNILKDEL